MSNIIPPELVRKLAENPDFDMSAFLETHQSVSREISIRINPAKKYPKHHDLSERVPWCDTGFYLPERPVFTLDPFFHAGCYYVQEASSMFVAHVLRSLKMDTVPLVALDLCAAPGGKSTLLNSYLHPGSLLVANEIIKSRVNILTDNLTRWGNANTVITNNDPSSFKRLPGYVDLMLVDAPCSGSGMFRKDPGAIDEWSASGVKLCSERQQRILADSLAVLKTGGILLYATCSYSVEENEQIADWLHETAGLDSLRIPVEAGWGITETLSEKHGCYGYRFYPHKVRGEGFYISAFRKVAPQSTFDRQKVKVDKRPVNPKFLPDWVWPVHDFMTFNMEDEVFIFPKERSLDLQILKNVLYLKNAGTRVGRMVKSEIIPHHALALSNHRNPDIPAIALDKDSALQYLRKSALDPAANTDGLKGWALATYDGVALGWLKLIHNRINNYYPKEWRISNL